MFSKLFGLNTVGTIIKSRIEMISGALVAGIAAVASYGWVPYVTETIDPIKLAIIAGIVGINGAVTEYIRRWNAEV